MTRLVSLAIALTMAFSTSAFAQSTPNADPNFQSTQTLCEPDENGDCLPHGAQASGFGATASGDKSTANGQGATATGSHSNASDDFATANGAHSNADGYGSTASGFASNSTGNYSTATGTRANASGAQSTATGQSSTASGELSTATGGHSSADGYGATANGAGASAVGEGSTANGLGSEAGQYGTALGSYSKAQAKCVAMGERAECTEDDTVSLGNGGLNGKNNSRIVNMGKGLNDDDAVNMSQVRPIGDAFGAGSGYDTYGNFIAPNYQFQSGAQYNNVADALYDLDGRLINVENNPGGGEGPAGPPGERGEKGEKGDTGDRGADGRDGVDGSGSVEGSENITVEKDGELATVKLNDNVLLSEQGSIGIQGGPSMSSNGVDAGNRRVTNVSDGRIEQGSSDAVNGGQIWALEDRWDRRMDRQDERIDGLGAQMGAMTMMAGTPGDGGVAVGVGYSGSKAALAIGTTRRLSPRVSMSAGVSFGGGNKPVIGVGFRFGGR